MKSRSSSPQTSPQIVRRYRVDSSPAATTSTAPPLLRQSSLRIEELPKIAMNGFQPLGGPANATSNGSTLLSPMTNGSRKTSAETIGLITPNKTDSLKPNGAVSSPQTNSPLSSTSETPWSSAIGHATTSGKSGRVIERLMSENDKLKRDLNEQVIKCQELEKNLQTYKPQIEALRQENDNLSHARGVDSNLISRRDRKIEELKADLANERHRRDVAESLARQREREKDEVEEQAQRKLQDMVEKTKHATLHAEILETSHKQLSAEYKARAESFKKDLELVNGEREQSRKGLSRLDVVSNQLRQEQERTKRMNVEIAEAYEKLRAEQTARLKDIEEVTERENERTRALSAEMEEVVNQMRWVMAVKRNVKGAGAD